MRYSHLSSSATREAAKQLNISIGHNMATNSNMGEEKMLTFGQLKIEKVALAQ